MQSMAKDFVFKTNLIKMDFKSRNVKQRFIHIPISLFADLDKKFKPKQILQVSIGNISFLGKISRVNNKARKTKIYYIRIPRAYHALLNNEMFNQESVLCILTPIEIQ